MYAAVCWLSSAHRWRRLQLRNRNDAKVIRIRHGSARQVRCVEVKLYQRSALFWDFRRRRMVVCYRRFGKAYRPHRPPLKMGPISFPETSAINYHSMLRKPPEERMSHLRCGESLKSRIAVGISNVIFGMYVRACVCVCVCSCARALFHLTLCLLMSCMYRAPCKARNFNVTYKYMDVRLATLKSVSFYLLHNVLSLNQCRKLSCGSVVCKQFAS
jgi:hypothetical protein